MLKGKRCARGFEGRVAPPHSRLSHASASSCSSSRRSARARPRGHEHRPGTDGAAACPQARRSAQIVALQDTLRIQLPINQSRVTAIGYHSSGSSALPLDPIGTQANAGLLKRIVNRFFGDSSSGIRYYQISGGVGPETGGLDVGAPTGTDVYAPVDGSVMAVSDQIVERQAVRRPRSTSSRPATQGSSSLSTNLRADPALTVGMTVSAGRTKVGRIIDLSSVEQAALARYTQDRGQHVHIEVHAAGSLAVP